MIEKSGAIIADIKNFGISAVTVFPAREIKFDPVFRDMCAQNMCGRYGKCYTCPPHNGDFEELKKQALGYDYAILIQTIHNLEDSFDFEGMEEGNEIHNVNTAKTWEYLRENLNADEMLVLGAGGCKLCSRCGVIDDVPCRFPDKAISSVEGYCMNVADMTLSHGLKYINGENTVSYVSVFLIK